MDKKRRELLDMIASEIGCDYLSDINLPVNKEAVHNAVASINEGEYSLIEWENAVRYIRGEGEMPESQKHAKQMLLNH